MYDVTLKCLHRSTARTGQEQDGVRSRLLVWQAIWREVQAMFKDRSVYVYKW